MNEYWEKAVISEVIAARYVPSGAEETMIYRCRPYHGFVMNDADAVKEYYFSDGSVKRAGKNEILFLPKGCGYDVRSICKGCSYVIDFELKETVWDKPFSLSFRNYNDLLKVFRETVRAWQQTDRNQALCMKNIYEIILCIGKELKKNYMPNSRGQMITAAIEEIHERLADPDLSVRELAGSCGISDAYFRRLFNDKTGVNPREYITRMRIEHAGQILKSGQLSVTEVASACGYSEVSSFTREFTRRMGLSPLEYRKTYAPVTRNSPMFSI